MSISDNNMNSASHSVHMPQLSGPIHKTSNNNNNNIPSQDVTPSQANTYPEWSSGGSRAASSGADDEPSYTSTPVDSKGCKESGNTLSAYDRDTYLSPSSSSSRSRSTSRGAYDVHRVSQDGRAPGFPEDSEAKHRKLIDKIMGHKLAPSFLQ